MKKKRNNRRENAIYEERSKKLREGETPHEKLLNSLVPCVQVEDDKMMKVFRNHALSKLNEKAVENVSIFTTKGL